MFVAQKFSKLRYVCVCVCVVTYHFCWVAQIAFGISTAATVRVGNELGAGNPLRAKRAAYVSIAIAGTNQPTEI